jgi:ubiquinone/menaquinone biosynthesis C-methylase UbiE
MKTRYKPHAFFVLISTLCCLTCSREQITVSKYFELAYNGHNIEDLSSLLTDEIVFELENRIILEHEEAVQEFMELLYELNSHIRLSNFRIDNGILHCNLAESNDWLIKSGLGKAQYSARLELENGLIKYIQLRPTPETEKEFSRALDQLTKWTSTHKSGEIHRILSNGDIIRSSVHTKAFHSIMDEWIDSTKVDEYVNKSEIEILMNVLDVKPGMIIGEAGAGEGYHAVNFSKRVGTTGKIYANEISRGLLRKIEARCKNEGITNVITVLGGQTDARFPRNDLDMVFMRHVLHCMRRPIPWLNNVKRYMKPDATLVIIDGDPDILGYGWKYENTREEVIEMAAEAGFELRRLETIFLPKDYIYIFRMK